MSLYYQDDSIRLYHGDCLEVVSGLTEPIDLLLTDPPYAVSLGGSSGTFTRNKNKGTRNLNFFTGDDSWDAMTEKVLERVMLAAKKTNSAYVWCGHRQFGPLVESFERAGFKTKFLVWSKKCPIPAPPGTGWDSAAELCIYAFRTGRKWVPPTGSQFSNVIVSDSYRHGQPGKVDHPTQKPMVTAERPISASTEPGDTVLDIYAGSGTTLVAAKALGRKAIGVEIEERYCEIAAKRLAQEVLFT